MKQAKYPDGWAEARVKRVLAHYAQQVATPIRLVG